jgi:hypothetical protein
MVNAEAPACTDLAILPTEGAVAADAAVAPITLNAVAARAVEANTEARECLRMKLAVALQQEDMDRGDVLRGINR